MNLRRQLLLVSLLTLMLPWAGCEFIRETEIALREGQQQMVADVARAIAGSMRQYDEEFPVRDDAFGVGDQLYLHRLASGPRIDGYFDDWTLLPDSLRTLRGGDGPIRFAIASYQQATYLYVEVSDRNIVYATPESIVIDGASRFADRVTLVPGDFYEDDLPAGADLVWLGAIVHQHSREHNRRLFAKAHAALVPGARIAIRDVVMEPSRTEPAWGAMFAVNMLVNTNTGDTFTFDELAEDLQTAGFVDVELAVKADDMSSVVIATKPG